MIKKQVDIDELREYIYAAFNGDDEIVGLYDRSVVVKSVKDVCENIVFKIESAENISNFAISHCGEKVGYFSYEGNNLVSFGLNKEYRVKSILKRFWELIKEELGDDFTCALFSYNKRAIKWLEKNGMTVLFENITILKLCQ